MDGLSVIFVHSTLKFNHSFFYGAARSYLNLLTLSVLYPNLKVKITRTIADLIGLIIN